MMLPTVADATRISAAMTVLLACCARYPTSSSKSVVNHEPDSAQGTISLLTPHPTAVNAPKVVAKPDRHAAEVEVPPRPRPPVVDAMCAAAAAAAPRHPEGR